MRVLNKRNGVVGYYIGRPSRFGNPFIIGVHGDREEVVKKYKEWLLAQPELINLMRKEIGEQDVVCWCSPLRCHGDVIKEVLEK